jgi:hypothetical protein
MPNQMRILRSCLLLSLALISAPKPVWTAKPVASRQRADFTMTRRPLGLPILFERNVGQTDPQVKFLSHASGATFFVTDEGAELSFAQAAATRRKPITQRQKPDHWSALRMRLIGAAAHPQIDGRDPLAARINYFIGNNPNRWRSNVPTFRDVVERGAWRGVDVVYRENRGALECDFDVSPGAELGKVRLGFDGASSASVSASGNLQLIVGQRQVRFAHPKVYASDASGRRRELTARYVVDSPAGKSRNHKDEGSAAEIQVSFEVAGYDKTQRLIIDPTLTYSTYLGGTGHPTDTPGNFFGDSVNAIAVDQSDEAYIAGVTSSPDFPVTPEAYERSCPDRIGCGTGFVAKLDSTGGKILYATFLGGGGSGAYVIADRVNGIAVNAGGEAYVTGTTSSPDFPITLGAPKCTYGSAFVSRLSADGGSLIYSTCLGGDEGSIGNAIAVDRVGNAYVTGQASAYSFNVTSNGSLPGSGGLQDAFVVVLDQSGTKNVYASLLGSQSIGNAIAVSNSGYIYVTGEDWSGTVPTTSNTFEPKCKNKKDWAHENCFNNVAVTAAGFLAVLNPAATSPQQSLIYSTYIGGEGPPTGSTIQIGDEASGVAVDAAGRAYVTGTEYRTIFPTTRNAFEPGQKPSAKWKPTNFSPHAFVAVLNPWATKGPKSLLYSTLLGGSAGQNYGLAIRVDSNGDAQIVGQTFAANFPTTSGAIQRSCPACSSTTASTSAAFLTIIDPFVVQPSATLRYSTFLGGTGTPGAVIQSDAANGLALDSSGNEYVVGFTHSIFPVTPGAAQTVCNECHFNSYAGFVSKIDVSGALAYSTFLGGNGSREGGETGYAVALKSGNIYVAGTTGSTDFPVTSQAVQPDCRECLSYDGYDAFVAEINPAAAPDSQLLYATYLGGSDADVAFSMVLDANGNAYVAGQTFAADFPTTVNAYQAVCSGCSSGASSAFVSELNPDGSALLYSSYLDGSADSFANGITLDPQGYVLLTGATDSADFPVSPSAFQQNCPACANGLTDVFVAKLNPGAATPNGSLVYATLLGGSGIPRAAPVNYFEDLPIGIGSDSHGDAIVAGLARSADFPTTSNAYTQACPNTSVVGCQTGFVAVIAPQNPTSSQLSYSSYFPGRPTSVATDGAGHVYLTGISFPNTPVTPNAFMPTCIVSREDSNCEGGFVSELNPFASPASQLLYGTFLGGSDPLGSGGDIPIAINVNASGEIYVGGAAYSPDFPITPDAVQPTCYACGYAKSDAFLTKLNPSAAGAAQLVYSTFLGGSGDLYFDYGDAAFGIGVDSSGHVAMVGSTDSRDYPVTSNALGKQCLACGIPYGGNAFVAEFAFP